LWRGWRIFIDDFGCFVGGHMPPFNYKGFATH